MPLGCYPAHLEFSASGASWCTNYAPLDIKPDGIQNGLLFPYNTSLPIYHCPADRSTVVTQSGDQLTQLRWRSYNMSLSINGAPITVTGQPNQTIPLLRGRVIINEQQPLFPSGMTVNALHIVIDGVADVVIASATAGI